ncbi:MAG: DUF11 domain-containing protein, partial [Acidobacteria bacterium]|nr:DUF11 domain-containing protein [Acidobacteriota bacterium]
NNTDAESTTLVSVADVRIAVAGPPAATPGTVASYSFTVTNDGPSVAEAVTVSHTMPPGVTLVSVTGACTAFPCGLGTLPPSAVRTTTVTYQVPSGYIAPNPIQMSAAVSSTTNDNSTLNNQATVATPLSFGGDVEVLIAASTMSPGVGADFDYIITVRNLGPSDVTGTIISALLPAGTTYRAHAASVGTYVTGTSVWTIPALVAGGGSATLTLTVRADQAGPLAGTARRTGGAQPDPGSANDESTVTPVAVALADVSLIATGPAQVLAGSTIQYTLTVRNGGPGVATSVVVANPTPANLTFVSTAGACTTTFPCALGTLAPNEERVITVRFTVNLVPNGTLVQNTATVTASTPDNNTGNNASTANTTVDTRVDVAMTTSVVPSQARVGEPVTFTMTATNHGPNPASGLVATDALPAGLEFVSATPSAGSYDPLTGRWTIGTLPVGDTVTLTIVATVSLPGAITNSIVRTSQNEPDGDSSNDSASATINGGLYADIGVGTNAAPLDAVVGAPLTFTIIVRNYGRDLAPAVAVENLVPAAVQFVSASASAGTFDAVTGRWTVGSMTPGSAATLTVRTTVEQAGAFASTARVAGVGVFDPNPANDSDTVVLNAGTQVNLRVSKTAMRPMAGVFEEATFLVTIANDGPSPATGVEVTDALPTGLTFVSAQASQGSYSPGSGIWSVGALAATQTATLHLTTRVMSTGPLVNRAQLAAVDQGDVNIDDNTATAVIVTPATTAGGCADIEMRQSFPSVAQPGGLVPGRYTAVNLGPSYAENLSFGGRIPSGVAVESMSASAGGVCTLVDGVVSCSWPGATLIGEGGARTADIVFRVIPSLAASTTVWGWFVTHNVSGDCYSANDIADHYVFVDGGGERADLQMRSALMMPHGAVSETAVQVGEPFHLRFAITNHGPDAGWGDWALKLSEPTAFIIDERVTNAGVLSASGPGHWDWLTGPIAPGTTVYADFRVRLMRSTAVRVNALRLRGGPVDPDASNDVSQLVVDGIGGATGGGRWVTTARLGGPGASIVTGTGEGDRPQVRVFARSGTDSPLRFYAFDPLFRGGVRVAACDIDGDGIDEIVAGQGPGGAAVRVMRIADNTAVEVAGVEPFESSFRGGVFVSCADVDADGRGDVIVGAGPGRAAEVRVFSVSSTGWTPRASWTAYDGFTGGVRVAGAAHPGSGVVGAFHVLTTPGPGRTVEARVWAVGGASASLVAAGGAFHAGYTGGATATVADIDHDGILDLAIAPDDPRAGLLRVFSLASGRWIIDVPAGTAGFTSSIRVAAAVLADGPGVTELVVASGPGTQPVVDVYRLVPGGAIRG